MLVLSSTQVVIFSFELPEVLGHLEKLVSIKSYFLKVAKQPLWIILSLFLKVCSGSNGLRAIGRIRYIFLSQPFRKIHYRISTIINLAVNAVQSSF